MRRKWAGAAAVLAAAGMVGWADAPGSAAASRSAGAASPSTVATPPATRSAAPMGRQQADPPGACPPGGLTWSVESFVATPMDSSHRQWLVQESGEVSNSSPAAIIVGDGVGRVGRQAPAGAAGAVTDLALTPTGPLALQPGRTESFTGAAIVDSTGRPTNLGAALSYAEWQSPALTAGCPAPAGAASSRGTLLGVSVS